MKGEEERRRARLDNNEERKIEPIDGWRWRRWEFSAARQLEEGVFGGSQGVSSGWHEGWKEMEKMRVTSRGRWE